VKKVTIANPDGAHNIAVGLDYAVEIEVVAMPATTPVA
jgi:hypothetical protein